MLHCHLIVLSHWLWSRRLLCFFTFLSFFTFLFLTFFTASKYSLDHLCSGFCNIRYEFSFRISTGVGTGISLGTRFRFTF